MKKIVIAATVAALAGGVFADTQVYDMTLTVKTTASKENQKASGLMVSTVDKAGYGYAKNSRVTLRKQASMKIQGLFWGCDCDTIALPAWRRYNSGAIGGYVFWDSKSGDPYLAWPFTVFQWSLMNRIDKFQKVEGTWQFAQIQGGRVEDNLMGFVGAGFGTVKETSNTGHLGTKWPYNWGTGFAPVSPEAPVCNGAYVSAMSGNFAGFKLGSSDCVFCSDIEDVIPFCSCVTPDISVALTAAYGTWKLKYNASASKNLKKGYYITQSVKNKAIYNFGKFTAVRTYLSALGNFLVVPRGADVDDDVEEFDTEDTGWTDFGADEMVAASAFVLTADEDAEVTDFLPFDEDADEDDDDSWDALPAPVKDMLMPAAEALGLVDAS